MLDQPARVALTEAEGSAFSVASTWCLRLPHQFLPIPRSYDQKGLSVAGAELNETGRRANAFPAWSVEAVTQAFGADTLARTTLRGLASLLAVDRIDEVVSVKSMGMQRTYRLTASALVDFVDGWLRDFASHANYLRFEGRPVLSVLNLPDFVRVYGLEGFRLILALARSRVQAAIGTKPFVIGLLTATDEQNTALARRLPLDAVTGYGLLPEWDGPPVQLYDELIARRTREWFRVQKELDVPFYPVVCCGWDATVRGERIPHLTAVRGFPWRPVVTGVTPEQFDNFLEAALAFNRSSGHEDIVFLHAWNEWTEGASIEPSLRFGSEFLERVRARATGRSSVAR